MVGIEQYTVEQKLRILYNKESGLSWDQNALDCTRYFKSREFTINGVKYVNTKHRPKDGWLEAARVYAGGAGSIVEPPESTAPKDRRPKTSPKTKSPKASPYSGIPNIAYYPLQQQALQAMPFPQPVSYVHGAIEQTNRPNTALYNSPYNPAAAPPSQGNLQQVTNSPQALDYVLGGRVQYNTGERDMVPNNIGPSGMDSGGIGVGGMGPAFAGSLPTSMNQQAFLTPSNQNFQVNNSTSGLMQQANNDHHSINTTLYSQLPFGSPVMAQPQSQNYNPGPLNSSIMPGQSYQSQAYHGAMQNQSFAGAHSMSSPQTRTYNQLPSGPEFGCQNPIQAAAIMKAQRELAYKLRNNPNFPQQPRPRPQQLQQSGNQVRQFQQPPPQMSQHVQNQRLLQARAQFELAPSEMALDLQDQRHLIQAQLHAVRQVASAQQGLPQLSPSVLQNQSQTECINPSVDQFLAQDFHNAQNLAENHASLNVPAASSTTVFKPQDLAENQASPQVPAAFCTAVVEPPARLSSEEILDKELEEELMKGIAELEESEEEFEEGLEKDLEESFFDEFLNYYPDVDATETSPAETQSVVSTSEPLTPASTTTSWTKALPEAAIARASTEVVTVMSQQVMPQLSFSKPPPTTPTKTNATPAIITPPNQGRGYTTTPTAQRASTTAQLPSPPSSDDKRKAYSPPDGSEERNVRRKISPPAKGPTNYGGEWRKDEDTEEEKKAMEIEWAKQRKEREAKKAIQDEKNRLEVAERRRRCQAEMDRTARERQEEHDRANGIPSWPRKYQGVPRPKLVLVAGKWQLEGAAE